MSLASGENAMIRLWYLAVTLTVVWIFGCAPTSQVMKEDLEKSRFSSAIKTGEAWLSDASLDEQATSEGRRIHRLVAEARLSRAKSQAELTAFTAFRKRYAQFSAYEDLLADAFENEAKLAFENELSKAPNWMRFEWFEKQYAQSSFYPRARELVVNAEFESAKLSSTLKNWSKFRSRFADWAEATGLMKEALPLEASAFRAERLNGSDDLSEYRAYATIYPDQMADPELVETLTRLETAAAKRVDTKETWTELEARYTADWSSPIIAAARLGRLNVEIGDARQSNTRQAFAELRARYEEVAGFPMRIRQAECEWVVNDLKTQIEMRQPLRQGTASYLIRDLMGHEQCDKKVLAEQLFFRDAAVGSDIWANRILRVLASRFSNVSPPLSKSEEAQLAWRIAKSAQRMAPLLDILVWYPSASFAEEADERLLKLREIKAGVEDRIQPFVWGVRTKKRTRHLTLISLVDRYLGPVAVESGGLRWMDTKSLQTRRAAVKRVGSFHVWVNGESKDENSDSVIRQMLTGMKRYFSIADRKLNLGSFYSRSRRIKWKKSRRTEELLAQLKDQKKIATVEVLERAADALAKRPLSTMLVHIGGAQKRYGDYDAAACEATEKDSTVCGARWLSRAERSAKPLSPLRRGVTTSAQDQTWSRMHRALGFESTDVDTMKSIGARLSKAARVDVTLKRKQVFKPTDLRVVPQYYWLPETTAVAHDATDKTSAKSPETEAPGSATSVPWVQKPNTSVQRFKGNWGEVSVVQQGSAAFKAVFLKPGAGDWLPLGTIALSGSDVIRFAQISSEGAAPQLCVLSDLVQSCVSTRGGTWKQVPITVPKGHRFGRFITSLKRRPLMLLASSDSGGLLRSIDGGRTWRLRAQKGVFSSVVSLGYAHRPLLCAHAQFLGGLNGVDCSWDDGLTWTPYFRSREPVQMHTGTSELVVGVGQQRFRLVRLIDRGSVQEALLFVGSERKLSKTGRDFLAALRGSLNDSRDWLITSSPADEKSETKRDETNQSLQLRLPTNTPVERWRFDLPAEATWEYAVVSGIGEPKGQPQ